MNGAKGENLHIYPSPIVAEGRILKETAAIEDAELFSHITICGTWISKLPRKEEVSDARRITRLGSSSADRRISVVGRAWSQLRWSVAVIFGNLHGGIEMVNAHSVTVLPVAFLLSRLLRAKLVYDTHELETETIASKGIQGKVFRATERSLIRRCDEVIVVSESIGDWYAAAYPGVRPLVVRNIPTTRGRERRVDVRELLGIPEDEMLFVHVGNLVDGRNIASILEAFSEPGSGHHVVFLGDGPWGDRIRASARDSGRVHYHPAVRVDEVVDFIAGCDVGLCLIEPSCLSYQYSLPNKALEYMQAGIPFFRTVLPEVTKLLGPELDRWELPRPNEDLQVAIGELSFDAVLAAQDQMKDVVMPSWDEESRAMVARYKALLRRGPDND
jgi:glycosyltransferase involved in cell wall biosynthesis